MPRATRSMWPPSRAAADRGGWFDIGFFRAGWLPGAGWRAVAADDLAGGAADLAGAVRADGQVPARLVQYHVVVPPVALYGPRGRRGEREGCRDGAGPAGFPAGLGCGWCLAVSWLSCGVADGCDQEFQVLVVQAGNGVAEGDWCAVGDADGVDAPFPAGEGQVPVVDGAEHLVPGDPGRRGAAVADAGRGADEAGKSSRCKMAPWLMSSSVLAWPGGRPAACARSAACRAPLTGCAPVWLWCWPAGPGCAGGRCAWRGRRGCVPASSAR
jgi:hypothetical protein